jgi:CRP-like cAMP-binding protein
MAVSGSEASTKDGLLSQILNSKAFAQIPPENLKKIVARIEMLPVSAGETIIRQGEVGDSFYILRDGRCRVVNYTSIEDDTMEIATLGPGDSFGEEALIRGAPRNATVEMMSDGYLARLSKEDFESLIQKPLLQGIDPVTVQRMIARGAIVIDVRNSADYANYSIPGSHSIPLDFLRQVRRNLEKDKTYITCSDNELESALATFLLAQKGLDARYLAGSVSEYLRATGDYDKATVVLPGDDEDSIIELPEEEEVLGGSSVITVGETTPVPEPELLESVPKTVPYEPIAEKLSQDPMQALREQGEQHRREMQALRNEMQKLVDGRTKALLREFRTRIMELERKLAAIRQK